MSRGFCISRFAAIELFSDTSSMGVLFASEVAGWSSTQRYVYPSNMAASWWENIARSS